MNATYHFGLLLLVSGGVLALNSTGLFASVGLAISFTGTLIGVLGLIRSGLSGSKPTAKAR